MPEDDHASVRVVHGGPMIVDGAPLGRLVRDGDAWKVVPIDTPRVYALCRCGRSSGMPFCDRRADEECFEEQPKDGPDPRPFTWDVPDPNGPPALAIKSGGPVRVAGDVVVTVGLRTLDDTSGRVSLCRCGASRCQPLCDSSHKVIGFEA
jgi:CDGSH-type Zn-finger protein